MGKRLRRILVVGSPQGFTSMFEQLEVRGYRFEYVADSEAARTYLLRQEADVLLLRLPAEEAKGQETLVWLNTIKEKFPVVAISCEEDVHLYLTAMKQGAFDYFTYHTPLEEIRRVLENALRWHQHQAA